MKFVVEAAYRRAAQAVASTHHETKYRRQYDDTCYADYSAVLEYTNVEKKTISLFLSW
jgi:hypothetical protein